MFALKISGFWLAGYASPDDTEPDLFIFMQVLKSDNVFLYFIRMRGPAGACRLDWGETFGICIKSAGVVKKCCDIGLIRESVSTNKASYASY
jgi:hypothetical protein